VLALVVVDDVVELEVVDVVETVVVQESVTSGLLLFFPVSVLSCEQLT
jgi:hypothetical protein